MQRLYLVDYKREYNSDIKIVRIFNIYGSNMTKNDGRVVSNFIYVLNNKNITATEMAQTRCFSIY